MVCFVKKLHCSCVVEGVGLSQISGAQNVASVMALDTRTPDPSTPSKMQGCTEAKFPLKTAKCAPHLPQGHRSRSMLVGFSRTPTSVERSEDLQFWTKLSDEKLLFTSQPKEKKAPARIGPCAGTLSIELSVVLAGFLQLVLLVLSL